MRRFIILVSGLLLTACGDESEDATVGKEIADDLNEAMEKAREVEDKMMEHKDDIDEAVKKAVDEAEEARDEAEQLTDGATGQ